MKSLFLHLFLLWPIAASGQVPANIGGSIAIGVQNEMLPEGSRYKPNMLLGYADVPFFKGERKTNVFFYIEPQLVWVFFADGNEFEFGLNGGVKFEHWIRLNTGIYGGIGAGPHFITVDTRRQANGFIFSDNFFVGLRQRINKDLSLNMQLRYRHISNAGLKRPNGGIDNFFGVVGIYKEM
ncbi:MAG: hypothetical protein ACJAUH_001710 [Saprospiraceae bacterium]|jgi:hypothetical protein